MENNEMDEIYEQDETMKERNLKELDNLMDLIYYIFANQFKYEVIRATFANITTWESIEISNAINFPRTLRVEPTEKIARKEQGKHRSLKGSTVAGIEESSEEQILSLLKSVDQTFFDKLFPSVSSDKKNKSKKEKPKKKK